MGLQELYRAGSALVVNGSVVALAAVLALLSTGISLAAQPQRSVAAPARGVMAMDVAGIRLGMSKEAAQAAAAAASYRCETFGGMSSFEEKVQLLVLQRRGERVPAFGPSSGTMQLNCKGPNGEGMRVDFAQVRAGDVVHDILLRVDAQRVDQAAMRRQVAAKYGPPSIGEATVSAWCDPGQRCSTFLPGSETPYPRLAVEMQDGMHIAAWRGTAARRADEAAVLAEAARRAPARDRAAF